MSVFDKLKGYLLVHRAAKFAKQKHSNHRRKYTNEPYFNHLHEVASLVKGVAKARPEVVAGAYLHDTIEDTDTSREEINKKFGSDVSRLVWECTDQHPYVCEKRGERWYHRDTGMPMNRKARKEIDNEHLRKSSPEGATIKLADFVSNTKDISKNDPNFAKVYLKEKEQILPHLKHGHPELYRMASKSVDK